VKNTDIVPKDDRSVATSDERLMELIATGDRDALAEFLRRHLDSIVNYARRYTGDPDDANDVAQETFVRVWQKGHSWKPGGSSPMAWVYRICYNLCIDLIRKRRPNVSLVDVDDPPAPALETPEHRLMSEARTDAVMSALDKLPERQYTALSLCAYQGLSNKDAAAVMEISVEALESLLSRARRTLKTQLQDSDLLP
jgi:RNA polymerase sigma-70 factor (ECF subfamily)